jgi:hypothetical protein
MDVVRILDFGCGDGRLLGHVLGFLSALRPTIRLEVFGLDVTDAGQQAAGYFGQTTDYLERHWSPLAAWRRRDLFPSDRQRVVDANA